MRINYLCPKCDAFLRVGDSVIFYVISSQTSRKGLILLHADLGNYSVTNHPNISFNKGDYVEFFCPVCHANLAASTTNNNLVRIKMV
ncbi:MAG: hypothetical protein RQ866_05335, partial [Bacteroidales bacterium]|nr:hypothetical protein [Bacteroidales bacterium]